jgi:ribonuclease P protein component
VKQSFDNQPKSSAFKKSSRLLNSNDFQTVFNAAPIRASHQHFLLLARQNQLSSTRLGLVIAKKNIRLAVDRNRMKRLIRETFRVKQQLLVGLDVIVLARNGMNNLSNAQLIEQLDLQWLRLIRKNQKHKIDQGLIDSTKGSDSCAG